MTPEKLKHANDIALRISQYKAALGSFEWSASQGGGTRNPQLVVVCDDCEDGRETVRIPFELSNHLIYTIKETIKRGLQAAEAELDAL